MNWKIAEAKQNLSDVVRRAAREPQVIFNRNERVAAVIAANDLEEFLAWRSNNQKRSLADALLEAARICEEEGTSFEAPARVDRAVALAGERESHGGRRAPRRHQRRK